jgi:hypothetical protein
LEACLATESSRIGALTFFFSIKRLTSSRDNGEFSPDTTPYRDSGRLLIHIYHEFFKYVFATNSGKPVVYHSAETHLRIRAMIGGNVMFRVRVVAIDKRALL